MATKKAVTEKEPAKKATSKTAKKASSSTLKAESTSKKTPKTSSKKKAKVLFIASEAAPFIATGGLADVIGSLPKALAKNNNYDISVIIPLYSRIKDEFRSQFTFLKHFNVKLAWRQVYCGIFYYEYEGVKFYFIDNEYYFKREGNIYGHYDDGERFAYFSKAALDAIVEAEIYPDIIHCNDWQTAASIVYIKSEYYKNEIYKKIKTVYTIHNIEYQGQFANFCFEDLFGFEQEFKNLVEFDGCINLMKGAIELSDVVNTVSPTYAEEIKDSFFAHGLQGIVTRNAQKVSGILNGIDVDSYNPETDKYLFANYSVNDISGKAVCKRELQKMFNLPEREDVPVIAIISRLVSHKGMDLITEIADDLLYNDVQFIVLGQGDLGYENYFINLSNNYKGKAVAVIAFNQDLSRKIYSGADLFLMPSKMEPCGLSQMIASRYGTVSIVRETGGLNDSIKAFNGETGNGYTFHYYNAHDMLYVIKR